mgnify:CR=1 FL=1
MAKKTKIIATVSDKRCDVDFIRQLWKNGMNVVRMNSAHLSDEGFLSIINNVRAVSPEIGILMDTKGPEVRTTIIEGEEGNEKIQIKSGDIIKIAGDAAKKSKPGEIYVTYPDFVKDVKVGDHILFDDGEIDVMVLSKNDICLTCEAQNEGELGSRKSVNVPGVRINLPSLTERDKHNILFAIENDVDFIAHSFVRSKQDVLDIQQILDEHDSPIKIIAKIENQEGVDNIDEIIEASYGIMIARGDLGIEVPFENIPGIQRKIIRKCVLSKKPVIVATQMLHTMINNPRPTRAEVTDVANAIYYRTDALMLSGETASGKYPIEAVKTMVAIAEQAEKDRLAENNIDIPLCDLDDVTGFLSKNAIEATEHLGVKCIITDTVTGKTARNLSAFRGPNPVISLCCNDKVHRLLALNYGVITFSEQRHLSSHELYVSALHLLLQKGYVTMEDKVAYLSGSLGQGGGNTFLEINKVKDVIK